MREKDLESILAKEKTLIDIARPYMDMVSEAVQDEKFIITLTDKNGCIIYLKGKDEIKKNLNLLYLTIGAYMDEESIGTNAMGTAIKEDKYVQITAEEHYIDIFQGLTCSTAPIHNSRGEIIGTFNLTGKSSFKYPHTLGLVIFGVIAIENELCKIEINNILGYEYICTKSVIDDFENGLMIVDVNGKIKEINKLACEYFGADKSLLLGDDVKDIIENWNNIITKLSFES